MATMDVFDADGVRQTIQKPSNPGRAAAADSKPVVLSTEDLAALPQSPNATSRLNSAAATTNATSVKASAGLIFKVHGYNAAASARYLKIYNKATAPTVGTDTPVKTFQLAPTAYFDFNWPTGYSLATGIAFAFTAALADNDTTALTLADILAFNLDYR